MNKIKLKLDEFKNISSNDRTGIYDIENLGIYHYINGKYHRSDGPAIEKTNGNKYWCINGQLHRLDGPAIVWRDGAKKWFINDIEYTEKDFNIQIYLIKNNLVNYE